MTTPGDTSADNVRALKRGTWLKNGGDVFVFEDTFRIDSGPLGNEARVSAMLREFGSPHRWVATLTIDGAKAHESEHETAADGAAAIAEAAGRAQKLRWKP